jgi:Lon protease-like protein
MDDDRTALSQFSGTARLFPLPSVVLYPQVVQPLHIFEPRYRQMTADALAGDRFLTMCLLQAGWQSHYQGKPPVHSVACLGRIVSEQRLPDGRFNLLLRGLCRVQIIEELVSPTLYRTARVEVLADRGPATIKTDAQVREELAVHLKRWVPTHTELRSQFRKLLKSDLPLGAVCDVFAFALPLRVEAKQRLLEELDVEQRALQLVAFLDAESPVVETDAPAAEPNDAPPFKFPPSFSDN